MARGAEQARTIHGDPVPGWLNRTLLLLIAAGIVAWFAVGPLTKTPRHVDEGLHAIGARYFLLDPWDQLLHPDYNVGGWPDWQEGARSLLAFPPLVDVIYGAALGAFGLNSVGFGAPLLLAGLLTAFSLYLLGRRLWDQTTGLAAAALFLWSAAGLRHGNQLEAEPVVTALGALAVALIAEGTARRRQWPFGLAGACLAAAFLMKLYLVLFPCIVALTFLVEGLRGDRVGPVLRRWLVLVLTALAVGCSHLAVVAAAQPADLPAWKFIYLRTLVERAGVASEAPAWYYAGVLYRDFAALAIPLVWAATELFSRRPGRGASERAGRWIFATTVVGIVILHGFSKQESAYLYPLMPFIVLLAARGLVGLARITRAPGSLPRALLFGGIASLAAGIGVVALWISGLRRPGFDGSFVSVHTFAIAVVLGALFYWRSRPSEPRARIASAVFLGVSVAWGAVAAVESVRANRADASLEMARTLAMTGSCTEAGRPPGNGDSAYTFVAMNWQPMSALMWENGRPWYWDVDRERPWSEQVLHLEPSLGLFLIDKEFRARDGGPPTAEIHAAILDWLKHDAEDMTAKVETSVGHSIDTYVYRRPERTLGAARLRSPRP